MQGAAGGGAGAVSGVVAARWREEQRTGRSVPFRWWGQLLAAAATVRAPLAAAAWTGLENSCETKAHSSPREVRCGRLLIVSLCSRSPVLDVTQRADLTGVQP